MLLKLLICRYHLHMRPSRGTRSPILSMGFLFQQWVTEIAARIMKGVLDWVTHNQRHLRGESYRVLMDVVREYGEGGAERVGQVEEFGRKVILPASITSSPRYYKVSNMFLSLNKSHMVMEWLGIAQVS